MMELLKRTHDEILYPADRDRIQNWIRKWKISDEQLTEAILETGSIHSRVLEEYLVKKGAIFSLFHFLSGLLTRDDRK